MGELDFSDFLHELHLEGPGFSWMSPESIMHTRTVKFVAVLFDLGLYGGGVISKPVEPLDLRHLRDSFPDRAVQVICCDRLCVFSGFIVDVVYFCCVAMKALQFMIESRGDMQTRKHEQ